MEENQDTVVPKDTTIISLESVRNAHTVGLKEYWDYSASYGDNLRTIFNESILLPEKEIQLPVLLAYATVPSALSNILPVVFFAGKEGSGKSQTLLLMSAIHNCPVYGSNTTYAGLRNTMGKRRFVVPKNEEGEKNYICCFDNVNIGTLKNELMLTYFLSGYNRRTDIIEIAKEGGENLTFRVFGPKVISSVHPIHADPALKELARRLVVIKFKTIEEMTEEEIGDFDVFSRLDLESVDLSILNHEYNNLWNVDNQHRFMDLVGKLKAKSKDFKIPKIIKSHQWTLLPDVIAAGIVSGVFNDIPDALRIFGNYWEWNITNVGSSVGAMQKAILHYVKDKSAIPDRLAQRLGLIEPTEIRCDALKTYLDGLAREGALETYPTPQNVTTIMTSIGWKRDLNKNEIWVWVPVR
jgi:hypothetical protein